ncbi:hypothetical protein DFH27DRAFT_599902 [Peziza echinospora]|nr:hypothetical protein DFH27DRAFT_599902 [Peziza echinospora]
MSTQSALPATHIHALTPLPPSAALPLLASFIHWTSATRPIRDRKYPYNNVPVPPFPASVLTNLRRIEMGLRGEQAPRLYVSSDLGGKRKRNKGEDWEGEEGQGEGKHQGKKLGGGHKKFTDDDDGDEGMDADADADATTTTTTKQKPAGKPLDKKAAKKLRKQEDKRERMEKRRKQKESESGGAGIEGTEGTSDNEGGSGDEGSPTQWQLADLLLPEPLHCSSSAISTINMPGSISMSGAMESATM